MGNRLTDKTGVASLRDNGETLIVTVLHHFADLLGRLGLDDDRTLPLVFVHPVVIIARQVIGCCGAVYCGQKRGRGREKGS